MDARCVNCNKKADFDIDKSKVTCKECGLELDYEEYIERMKEKAVTMADDFQTTWDKRGF
ncbi:hypothetical protein YTPLAS21_17930 [Candidatus Nitrosocosmicus sp.]|nr:hypothetical protein YTPLAS21_17930 [Candidatus Nitrosocosmicus sp.]